MALLTIDGTAMPDPVTYSAPMADMESSDSAYSESGVKIRNRIRQGIVTLELGWRVSDADAATILAAIEPGMVEVGYLDPRSGMRRIADMYVEDRSCNLLVHEGSEPDQTAVNWWEISFSLVEY